MARRLVVIRTIVRGPDPAFELVLDLDAHGRGADARNGGGWRIDVAG